MNLLERLHQFRSLKWLVLAILAVDAIAMGYGWFYYVQVGQFDPSSPFYVHWAWWPLVSDSPNAVLLFFIALAAYTFGGWRNQWLDAFSFTLNVYVGLWTSTLFLLYADTMGTWNWGSTNNILFFAHFGMPLQALVLVHRMRQDTWNWKPLALMALGLIAYIFVDYVAPGFHPAPFLHPNDAALHVVSPILMAAAFAALLGAVLIRRGPRKNSPP